MKAMEMNREIWVGIDWGHESHAVAVVSQTADVMERFVVPDSPAGYATLDQRLARYATVRGIAVESTRHTLVLHVMARGYPLYLINPKLSKAWRETDTVSGAKSDQRDGATLARGLALRYRDLIPTQPGDPAVERLALLCEKECSLIHQRTALVQELKAVLTLYYPAALDFFANWTSPAAWDFLMRFPTAATLCRAREDTLIAFLKGHRLGWSPCWEAKVKNRGSATDWPTHPHEGCHVMHACGLVRQLKALQGSLSEFRREIDQAFVLLPQARLVESLPGAGQKLAPRLMAILASAPAHQGGLEALRGHSGVAPITVQSGKRRTVRIRRMCNKQWRNTVHLFAWCSTRASTWAKAFYEHRRVRGDTHSTALRKLADKWLHIIVRMMQTNEVYDEQRYLRALRNTDSPTWRYLNEKACG